MTNIENEIDWETIITRIRKGRCLPIINYHASSDIFSEHTAIVKAWAENVGCPLADRSNLTRIAQFVSVDKGDDLAAKELYLAFLKKSFLDGYKKTLSGEPDHFLKTLEAELPDLSFSDVIARLDLPNFKGVPTDPLRILAELPLPIYLTTNYTELLEEALKVANDYKEPQTEICYWRQSLEGDVESVFEKDPNYQPTKERPLVYHLHGRDAYPASLVLTEDDYLDFLVKVSEDPEIIPRPVSLALADWSLLLLGYQLHEWDFRTVFKELIASKRRSRSLRFNLSIQLNPKTEGIDIIRARAYLERYFGKANFTIYWGDAQSFTQELWAQWTASHDR